MTWRNLLIMLVVVGFLGIAANSGFEIYTFSGLTTAQNDLKRSQADNRRLATEALKQSREIQRQRYDSTYNNCIEQNHRHDKTFAVFDKALAQVPPAERRGAASTIALLNAAVPHRDCLAAARLALGQPGPPLPSKSSRR